MMTFSRRARTKQLLMSRRLGGFGQSGHKSRRRSETYYALGNERPMAFMTSAMQMVADLETPTRQCTSVAVPSFSPFSVTISVYGP